MPKAEFEAEMTLHGWKKVLENNYRKPNPVETIQYWLNKNDQPIRVIIRKGIVRSMRLAIVVER